MLNGNKSKSRRTFSTVAAAAAMARRLSDKNVRLAKKLAGERRATNAALSLVAR